MKQQQQQYFNEIWQTHMRHKTHNASEKNWKRIQEIKQWKKLIKNGCFRMMSETRAIIWRWWKWRAWESKMHKMLANSEYADIELCIEHCTVHQTDAAMFWRIDYRALQTTRRTSHWWSLMLRLVRRTVTIGLTHNTQAQLTHLQQPWNRC